MTGSVAVAELFFVIFFGLAAIWFGIVVFRTHSMVRSALALLFSQTTLPSRGSARAGRSRWKTPTS